jgi:hypothetical protein
MRASCSLSQGFEVVEDRRGGGPAERDAPLGRGATGLLLDGIEPGDTLDRSSAIGEAWARWTSTNLRRTWAMQATSRMAPER